MRKKSLDSRTGKAQVPSRSKAISEPAQVAGFAFMAVRLRCPLDADVAALTALGGHLFQPRTLHAPSLPRVARRRCAAADNVSRSFPTWLVLRPLAYRGWIVSTTESDEMVNFIAAIVFGLLFSAITLLMRDPPESHP